MASALHGHGPTQSCLPRLLSLFKEGYDRSPNFALHMMPYCALVGGGIGLGVGIPQWWLLRRSVQTASWWLLVSNVGWAVTGVMFIAAPSMVGALIAWGIDINAAVHEVLLLFGLLVVGVLVSWLLRGVITGVVGAWLMTKPPIQRQSIVALDQVAKPAL